MTSTSHCSNAASYSPRKAVASSLASVPRMAPGYRLTWQTGDKGSEACEWEETALFGQGRGESAQVGMAGVPRWLSVPGVVNQHPCHPLDREDGPDGNSMLVERRRNVDKIDAELV